MTAAWNWASTRGWTFDFKCQGRSCQGRACRSCIGPVAVPLCMVGLLLQRARAGDASAWSAAAGPAAIDLAATGAGRSCRRVLSTSACNVRPGRGVGSHA